MNRTTHERTGQLRADGSLRHLLTLEGLPTRLLEQLLERAQHFVREIGERPARSDALRGVTVAALFSEPSTRTRLSFELAARRLGADVASVEVQLSSRLKGESILDTVRTLEALHVDVLVLRDAEDQVPDLVARHVEPHVSVLSGGAGSYSHPSQGLLDALTIHQSKGAFEPLSVAIVGDIRHSRVARSAWHALRTLGVRDLRVAAPPALMASDYLFEGCRRFDGIDEAVRDCDVIMMLRIQTERMTQAAIPDGERYFAEWGLTPARLALAKPDAIVMHPQPMNRGVEIASEVADGPQSVIRAQVRNGVAVRMALLEAVAGARR
jgi:aspartate carbamoyltransferase catalytic subunit